MEVTDKGSQPGEGGPAQAGGEGGVKESSLAIWLLVVAIIFVLLIPVFLVLGSLWGFLCASGLM